MDANVAARIFHDWAVSEGLIPDGPLAPVSSGPAELALVHPVKDLGKLTLRAKQVQTIAFNDQRKEVIVFLKRAVPSKRVLGDLPSHVDDVSIRYRQGANIPIGPEPPQPFSGPSYVVRHPGGGDFYTCGSSISVANFREAGTLGCLVRDHAGVMHGLSNNHVSGSCNYAGVGQPILAPGVIDCVPNNLAPFTVGFHAKALPLLAGAPDIVDPKGNSDAAMFRIKDEALVSSYQRDAYDTPAATAPLTPSLDVEKAGRTTGYTKGKVVGQLHGALSIPYHAGAYGFNGPVPLEPMFVIYGNGDLFSDGGDSGSLITAVDSQGQRTAVGIVVGGMNDARVPGGKATLALPIEPILTALGVTLVSGHNI